MPRIRRCAAAVLAAGLLTMLGLPIPNAQYAAAAGPAAAFALVAAKTPANGELNFDGAFKGNLVITVPLGAAVELTLTNNGTLPHSLEIIPYSDRMPATAVAPPAFPGAVTKNPETGILKGQTAKAQFTAGKAGKYLLICGFPGHALLGMYGIFEVAPSSTVKPTMVIKK